MAENFSLKYHLTEVSLLFDPPPCVQLCLAHRDDENFSSFRLSKFMGENSFDIA